MNNTSKKKTALGITVSDKMNKTIVVKLARVSKHQKYKRIVKRFNKVKVHDEKNSAKTGDLVRIGPTRPVSKDKRWKLVEIVKKAV